ncbi:NTF2-like protein, partial [Aureobasidium melanogenum]
MADVGVNGGNMFSTSSKQQTSSIIIQPPITKLGQGPGLILLVDDPAASQITSSDCLDPCPRLKWAEEGYIVAELMISDESDFVLGFSKTISALKQHPANNGKQGLGVISCLNTNNGAKVSSCIDEAVEISAVVSYGESHPILRSKPHLAHVAGQTSTAPSQAPTKMYTYPMAGPFFVLPSHTAFDSSSAAVSHSRSLTFLKSSLGGPFFDLEAIWDEHTRYEFETRAVEQTMATMVQEPYVNHVPTLTGGIGRVKLTDFYRNHFIFSNPDDTTLELVSRTVGIDRVIDEFIFNFTHDKVIDWLLPGVPPTGKKVRVPFTGVVNIRGDKLYHEHIWWDQASVLVQLGLLPEYLTFPYAVDGRMPAPGKRFEYRVPAAGADTALKLTNENAVESNLMFDYKVREVDEK